jgi:hypothetical protein
MQTTSSPILASEDNLRVYSNLVAASHRSYLEVESALPWANGIDKSIAPKRAEHSWIHGTRYWDMLTEAQRLELLWLETGRDVTAFIKLERFLPVLYVGYINKFRDALPKPIYDYLMIFSKEEIVHTLIFKRYMKLGQLPLIQDPDSPYKNFIAVVNDISPVFGIFFTLIVEWAAELNAVFLTQFEGAEPMTQKLFREHHMEEVRHIAFGKRIVEDYVAQATEEQMDKLRQQFVPIVKGVYDEITYNRMIGNFTSFAFPVGCDDTDAIAEIRNSAHNREINKQRFHEMDTWLEKIGVV